MSDVWSGPEMWITSFQVLKRKQQTCSLHLVIFSFFRQTVADRSLQARMIILANLTKRTAEQVSIFAHFVTNTNLTSLERGKSKEWTQVVNLLVDWRKRQQWTRAVLCVKSLSANFGLSRVCHRTLLWSWSNQEEDQAGQLRRNHAKLGANSNRMLVCLVGCSGLAWSTQPTSFGTFEACFFHSSLTLSQPKEALEEALEGCLSNCWPSRNFYQAPARACGSPTQALNASVSDLSLPLQVRRFDDFGVLKLEKREKEKEKEQVQK